MTEPEIFEAFAELHNLRVELAELHEWAEAALNDHHDRQYIAEHLSDALDALATGNDVPEHPFTVTPDGTAPTDQSSAVPPVSTPSVPQDPQGETPIMASNPNPVADAVKNEIGKSERAARRDAAMAADSRQQRAAHAAGRDTRSIGVTRTAYRGRS
ncbi:hypothetical protein ACQP2F_00440 [Actinoplanes sp. CA-030573]|uniref:hypothetical protein n=1 Tax=Actinoplanes sp. CA-030573 TaxID=3239898 RepID=UPI003D8C6C34